ncbi:MAG: PDZ domain-containing protein [Gemmatimonadota bacterium]|nr:PDZ domain-containing protein [Gemmatimonadota bacterium]
MSYRCSVGRSAALATAALLALAPARDARAQKTRASTASGWVGISVIQRGQGNSTSATLGYPVIASVEPGSPAQSAGLVAGDTILSYNSMDANGDPGAVQRFLKPGSELVVKIRRNGVRNLRLTVARRSAQNPYRSNVTISSDETMLLPLVSPLSGGPVALVASVPAGRDAPFAGTYFARLNPGLVRALSVSGSGVLVVDVGPGSAAMRAGLQAGDIITRADSLAVASPVEIATAMRLASERSVTLLVTRQGKPRKVTVEW